MSVEDAVAPGNEVADSPAVNRRIRDRMSGIPVWAVLLFGYIASRVLSFAVLAGVYAFAHGAGAPIAHFDGPSGFLGFLQSWDGLHYRQIALHGYPTRLPIDATGAVQKNPWAFLPLYPLLVKAVMTTLGTNFGVAAVAVSLLAGGAATFALYRLLLNRLGERPALWGALFFCFGPMSFLFSVAYADGLFVLLMVCSLIAMASRRWLLTIPFSVAASFSHPGAVALAAAIGFVCLTRLLRRDENFGLREKFAAGTALATSAIAGFAWPVIAGIVTGDRSAYFDTETAWWAGYIGHSNFIPFSPWLIFATHYLGGFGIVLVVAIVGGCAYLISRRSFRALGTTLVAYTASYVAYLFAVFLPQQSLIRMLLPLSPALGHPALTSSRLRRRATLAACIALQPVAALLLWAVWPP